MRAKLPHRLKKQRWDVAGLIPEEPTRPGQPPGGAPGADLIHSSCLPTQLGREPLENFAPDTEKLVATQVKQNLGAEAASRCHNCMCIGEPLPRSAKATSRKARAVKTALADLKRAVACGGLGEDCLVA